jgi:hypothetical protein
MSAAIMVAIATNFRVIMVENEVKRTKNGSK